MGTFTKLLTIPWKLEHQQLKLELQLLRFPELFDSWQQV